MVPAQIGIEKNSIKCSAKIKGNKLPKIENLEGYKKVFCKMC